MEADGKVADACAGPHLGNETFQEYFASAREIYKANEDIYDKWNKKPKNGKRMNRPGEVEEIEYCVGVDSLDRCSVRDFEKIELETQDRTIIDLATTSVGLELDRDKSINMEDIASTLASITSTKLQSDIRINEFGSQATWRVPEITKEGSWASDTNVDITVLHSGGRASGEYYLAHRFKSYHDVHVSRLKKPAIPDQKGYLNLYSESPSREYSFIIWVRGNVCIFVDGHYPIAELDAKYAKPINASITPKVTNHISKIGDQLVVSTPFPGHLNRNVPVAEIKGWDPLKRNVRAGDTFTVSVPVSFAPVIIPCVPLL